MRVTVPDDDGLSHVLEIDNVLYDPLAMVNLVSVQQMNTAGYAAYFLPGEEGSALITPRRFWDNPEDNNNVRSIPIVRLNNVFVLTPIENDIFIDSGASRSFAFPAKSK
eukprot:1012743-Rhodomonas_salina.1